MPSVGMRRTPTVLGMGKSTEVARVLRSGRQLWPDTSEIKPKRIAKELNEHIHPMKKSDLNRAAHELNGKTRRLGHVENTKKQSIKLKAKAEALSMGGTLDKMFGIVYTRKRKRNDVVEGKSEQVKFGKRITRRQASKRTARMLAFVVESGSCNGWFSSFLSLVLGYVKMSEVRLSELAAFLLSRPISGVYSSSGVNFLWGPAVNRTGVCKLFGARKSVPLFTVEFSAIPNCFLYMHRCKLLRRKYMQLPPENSEEMMSDSEEDESCVTYVVDANSMSKPAAVEVDAPSNKVVLHSSYRASKPTGRNGQSRSGLAARSIQKRRSSLRRRAKNPLLISLSKANGALMSDLISSRKSGIPFSSVVSKNKLRRSVRNSSAANLSEMSSSMSVLMQNVDLQCSANILVTEPDRCYRVDGAIVTLELSAAQEWLLVVKKDWSTKYKLKADKFMRPSSCNRYTHAIIWNGDDNWKLEFPNREDWMVFKDLYKECSERNVPVSTIKVIPVPGVREVLAYEDTVSVPFRRPDFYISIDADEVSRALAKRTANYDMDSEDEEWLKKFNDEFFSGNGHCEHLSQDRFELMVDGFEKACIRNPEYHSMDDAAAHLCLDLGTREVVEAVHAYWSRKRKQRRSSLLRVFQGRKLKEAAVVPKPLIRKRRSFKRQPSHGRGKQPILLQAMAAEHDALAEQNAMVKVEEARAAAARTVEQAILKRNRAQLLMQNADMATYKAMIALRIAEAACVTGSADDCFDL